VEDAAEVLRQRHEGRSAEAEPETDGGRTRNRRRLDWADHAVLAALIRLLRHGCGHACARPNPVCCLDLGVYARRSCLSFSSTC